RKVSTAHGLKSIGRHVGTQELRLSQVHARVKDCISPVRRDITGVGRFAVSHHHRDLSAEVLLIQAKGLLTVTAILQVGVKFHRTVVPQAVCPVQQSWALGASSYSSCRRTKSMVVSSLRPFGARSRIINVPINSSSPRAELE